MATLASSNRAKLSFANETVPGVIESPFYDNATVMRMTGESLNNNVGYANSEEIRADRQQTDLVQISADASGDVNIELSAVSYDPFLESLFGNAYTTADASYAAAGATVGGTNTFNSTAAFSALPVEGQWIKVSGRTVTANNGYFQVSKTVAPTSSVITLEGNPLTIDATSESTTFEESAMLRLGVVDKSFTIVKEYTDMATSTYLTFVGMRVSKLSLSFAVGSILTGSLSFIGLTATMDDTAAPDGVLGNETAASTTSVMNSVGDIANVWLDNATSASFFNNLSLDIDASLRQQTAIGTLGSIGIGQGRFNVSGNISAYFEDLTLYNRFNDSTSFNLAFSVEDNAGNAYIFSMGNVKFESATVSAGGSDQDIMMDGTYRASIDPQTLTMIQLDKWTV